MIKELKKETLLKNPFLNKLIRKVVSDKQRGLYQISNISLNERSAIFCNSDYVVDLVQTAIEKQIIRNDLPMITYNISPPKSSTNHNELRDKNFNGVDIVYCFDLAESDASSIDVLYYTAIKSNPDIVIQDQTAWHDKARSNRVHKFRNISYCLNDETVPPSHFANDAYINDLKKILNDLGNVSVLDMCAGQGSIGLCLLNELTAIESAYLSEVNPHQVNAINETIQLNNLPKDRIRVFHSDIFQSIPKEAKFDLITCNPPHSDRPAKNLKELQGSDPDWKFHRTFLSEVSKFLKNDGTLTLLENANSSKMEIFESMLPKELKITDTRQYKFTPWYILRIEKT